MISQNTNVLLRCLCRGSNIHHNPKIDWEGVVAASRTHLVAPLLYLRLKDRQGVPRSVLDQLEPLYHTNLGMNIRRLQCLGKFLALLSRENIPVVVLKGCHLAESVYKNVGARVFSDADLMVTPETLDRAQRCLLDAGAFGPESGLLIDLHWYLEEELNLDMDRIWSRTRPVTIGGATARVLSPEDLLMHLCLHVGFHHHFGFSGLRTLCDIQEIIFRYGEHLDWPYLIETAETSNITRALRLPLHLAKTLVSAQVPESALTALEKGEDMTGPEQWALSRMFTPESPAPSPALSPHFWQLWATGSWGNKTVSLRKVLMPNRKFIAQKYPTPHTSIKTWYYYLVRLKFNAIRYLSALIRILLNEPGMRRIKETELSSIRMKQWLAEGKEQ